MSGSDSITSADTGGDDGRLDQPAQHPSTSFPARAVTVSCYSATTSSG